MIRQKICRVAFGTALRGSLDSPAATPMSSVPWKENPATRKTVITPPNPLTNGASPVVQLEVPGDEPPMIPAIMRTPTMRKTMTAITLTMANQNSPSPYARAESRLSTTRMVRKMTDHTHPGLSGSQYCMTIPAADSSAATVMAQLNQ